MDNNIAVCVRDESKKEQARVLADKLGVALSEECEDGLTVLFEESGVSLKGFGLSYQGDFGGMLYRVTKGRLMHEMLVRAAKTSQQGLKAIDATAGMGEDSFLLAAYGYEVIMYEQNPVVAELLRDALFRAKQDEQLAEIVNRMTLVEGNSTELLCQHQGEASVIYLDPMFPARQKSGLINKKLQLIQKLEPPCNEENALFEAAMNAGANKIIVKRPLKSPFLAGKAPNHTYKGKAIRYDCYVGT